MKCENCGKDNPTDTKFCESCGNILLPEKPEEQPIIPEPTPAAVEIECPTCKHKNAPDAAFCNGCGLSLKKTEPTAPVEEPVVAPAEPVVPTVKVLVMPDNSEIILNAEKKFGRFELAKFASDPMWISREHFTIFEENGVAYVQDNGSSNGTKLNGKEIKQAGKQQLNDGDEIFVGEAVKVFFKTK